MCDDDSDEDDVADADEGSPTTSRVGVQQGADETAACTVSSRVPMTAKVQTPAARKRSSVTAYRHLITRQFIATLSHRQSSLSSTQL